MMFQLFDKQGPICTASSDTAVTIGVFDGVHRGHQELLARLASLNPQLSPLAVTLTSHPSFVLGRHANEYWLDDPDEHLRLLFDAGIHYVAVLPFTREVASLTACHLASLMHQQLQMRALLLGYDSRFGSKQDDDFALLPQLAAERGFTIQHGTPYLYDGQPVSSSRIRETLQHGDVDRTAALLGRHYTVCGTVRHGRGVGRTLGFPTANVDLSASRKMLPAEGVYAVHLDGHPAIANLGAAPTYGIEQPLLEVHLLDFEGDLYGHRVEVAFLHRLRGTKRFSSPEALQSQLHQDLISARQWL